LLGANGKGATNVQSGSLQPQDVNPEERETPPLRAMIMSDFVNAMKEISASVSENAHAIAELRKWNELYGEGGSRKKTTLTYYV